MARITLVLAALIALTSSASAQAARTAAPQETDALAVLTREIRALRTEIAETAKASLRLQLLTARIQAQEQRIIYLDRQRAEATTRRQNAERERDAMATQDKQFEPQATSTMSPEDRKQLEFMRPQFEFMRAQFKAQAAAQEQAVQQAMVEETDAQSALAQEQGRWADLNQRLDDLERSLK